jgi:hypothetical protein
LTTLSCFAFVQALDAMYGNHIERVMLFDSRAQGDARVGSETWQCFCGLCQTGGRHWINWLRCVGG